MLKYSNFLVWVIYVGLAPIKVSCNHKVRDCTITSSSSCSVIAIPAMLMISPGQLCVWAVYIPWPMHVVVGVSPYGCCAEAKKNCGIPKGSLAIVSITDHSHTSIVWGITLENCHQILLCKICGNKSDDTAILSEQVIILYLLCTGKAVVTGASGHSQWVQWLWWPTKKCYSWCSWTVPNNLKHIQASFFANFESESGDCLRLASYELLRHLRPYKITNLILIHLFPKSWGGKRHFIFIFHSLLILT